jgi:N-glycosylase/DNA lyase
VLGNHLITLKQTDSDIHFKYYRPAVDPPGEPTSADKHEKDPQTEKVRNFLKDYFQLDISLRDLYEKWSAADPNFKTKAGFGFHGIRVMRQDPVENLVTFICTSNNNIARITMMVSRRRRRCCRLGLTCPVLPR